MEFFNLLFRQGIMWVSFNIFVGGRINFWGFRVGSGYRGCCSIKLIIGRADSGYVFKFRYWDRFWGDIGQGNCFIDVWVIWGCNQDLWGLVYLRDGASIRGSMARYGSSASASGIGTDKASPGNKTTGCCTLTMPDGRNSGSLDPRSRGILLQICKNRGILGGKW